MAKKCEEPKKGSPLWMTTFADLMSLLFALFVLLYAMSEVNKEKFVIVSDSIKSGFSIDVAPSPTSQESVVKEAPIEDFKPLYESLIELFKEDIKKSDAEIDYDAENDSIFIRFSNEVAFENGSATLKSMFIIKLRRFFGLKKYRDEVNVKIMGHTDGTPLSPGAHFRSNWELSASRASAVAEDLIQNGMLSPGDVEVAGYADTHRLSLTNDPGDIKKDRRVEIVIKKKP